MANYVQSLSVGGLSSKRSIVRSADHENALGPYTLAAAKSGTLTTRTDNDTGVLTVTSHGLSVGDIVDVYWSGAGNVRYGMTITASADANTITVDGGAGDNLPAQASSLTVAEQQVFNTLIPADLIHIIGVCAEATNLSSTTNAHLTFTDDQGETILQLDLVANELRVWDVDGGDANDFDPSDTATFTVNSGTDIFTSASHGLIEGHQLSFTSTTTLPAGLTTGVWYYVKYIDANTFQVSTTLGGTAVNMTDTGTGTHTWTKRNLISKCKATNGSTAETLTLKIMSAEDSSI